MNFLYIILLVIGFVLGRIWSVVEDLMSPPQQ